MKYSLGPRVLQNARRAHSAKREGDSYLVGAIVVDLTLCHVNGCPLNLDKFLDAPEFDFMHDIVGIRDKLDRKTGALNDCFLPRCAR